MTFRSGLIDWFISNSNGIDSALSRNTSKKSAIVKYRPYRRERMMNRRFIWIVFVVLMVPSQLLAGVLESALEEMARELATNLKGNIKRPLPVVVLDFKVIDRGGATEGNSPVGATGRAEKLSGALFLMKSDFQVLERKKERLEDAIREFNFSQQGYVDQSTAVKVGNMVGAQALVYGKSEIYPKKEKTTVWIYSIEAGEIIATVYKEVRYTLPASYGGLRSMVLPGWGQWTLGHQGSGLFFLMSTVGLGGGALYASGKSGDALDEARLAGTPATRDQALQKESDWKSRRNWLLAGMGVAWISNVLHASWISSHAPIDTYVAVGERTSVALIVRF